ncbi:NAD-dependent epimerase/dehydratase family protein [Malaciobacter molluscorum]|uniref:NAD-dependent epimerase/dehydratase family protein n=1 Tax=Malaciobacter molluscorum TaxID=1032072 RepID=UPI0013E8F708|nr:SDR family oxidoreductase [Malaciobacter molluscorum]
MVITTGLSLKYLYNGHTGFVGKILSRFIPNFIIFNKNKAVNADVFLHLASNTKINANETDDLLYLKEVINYCKKNDIQNFVYFSTVSIYGNSNKENIKEDDISYNLKGYAKAKYLCEEYLINEIKDLNILILRMPAILTKKSDTYIVRLLEQLYNNEEIILKNYNKIFNNFISVEDISNFIKEYSFSKKVEIVNLASNKDQTLKDIVLYLKELTNSTSNIILDEQKSDFYNLNIEKINKIYNFYPISYKDSLKQWLKIRNEK